MTVFKNLKFKINSKRVYGLDILRAFAILFVVAKHGELLMPKTNYYLNIFIFDGVTIFFVLSGFLIGGILIKLVKENSFNSKLIMNFWIKRWFRTLPNYFLILTALSLLSYTFDENFSLNDKKRYFLFLQNLVVKHPDFFPEAWSLSVEEWFYILMPIILFVLIKGLKISINNSILFAGLSIIISVTLFRYFRYSTLAINEASVWDGIFRKQVLTRLDSLMYGVMGAYIYCHYITFWNKYRMQFLVFGLSLFIFAKFNLFAFRSFGLYDCVFSFSVDSIATLFILPYLTSIKEGKGFFYKLLTYISLISYSMYLVNLTIVQEWILYNIEWSVLKNYNESIVVYTKYMFYWVFTIGISTLIYEFFEIPIMNLREKVRVQ